MSTQEEPLNLHDLATAYVGLSARIKEDATILATMRKKLKKLDARLLGEMRETEIMEVTVNGVTIQRTTKLQLKA